MDPISKSVLKSVESGEYFEDAKNWYATKYLGAYAERSFIAIVALVAFFCFANIAIIINDLFPLKTQIDYFVNIDDTIKEYSTITPLDTTDSNTNRVVFKYLIENYIKQYEAYNYPTLQDQAYFVQSNSSKQILKQYTEILSLDNLASPILNLQLEAIREIKILSSNLSGEIINNSSKNTNERQAGKAIVNFEASIINNVTGAITKSNWQATMSFIASDIKQLLINKDLKFEFKVTDYVAKEINS